MLTQLWGYCFTALGAVLCNDLYGPGLIGKIAGIMLGVSLTIIGIVYGFNNARLNKLIQLVIHAAIWIFAKYIGSTLELIIALVFLFVLLLLLGKLQIVEKRYDDSLPYHINYHGEDYYRESGSRGGTMVYKTADQMNRIVIHKVWNSQDHSASTDIGMVYF